MIEEVLKCDQCKKQSSDICGDVDWITLESGCTIHFAVSNGRDEKGCHINKTCKGYVGGARELDFCSLTCMLEWMGFKVLYAVPIEWRRDPKDYYTNQTAPEQVQH